MPPIIDVHILKEYIEDMGEEANNFINRLIEIFLTSSPGRLAEIQAALDNRDCYRLNRSSHTLKSSSASVGAARLAAVCADVEARAAQLMKEDCPTDPAAWVVIDERVKMLLQEYTDFGEALRQLRIDWKL